MEPRSVASRAGKVHVNNNHDIHVLFGTYKGENLESLITLVLSPANSAGIRGLPSGIPKHGHVLAGERAVLMAQIAPVVRVDGRMPGLPELGLPLPVGDADVSGRGDVHVMDPLGTVPVRKGLLCESDVPRVTIVDTMWRRLIREGTRYLVMVGGTRDEENVLANLIAVDVDFVGMGEV